MKLLQESDGSLYVVIRAEGEEHRLTAKPSEAIIPHCGSRWTVTGPILRKVSHGIAVSAFAKLCKEELSYCKCAMLHCTQEFGYVFAVVNVLGRVHCSKRFGDVFAVSK
jgi:hypothetical protein